MLDGKGPNRIARELEEEGIPNWNGKANWYESSIRKMLSNESSEPKLPNKILWYKILCRLLEIG
ncbi:recombinase family protein [Clostridium thailandense]|uniref:recombinase family protein n=1 Tax=Clostridium thailandense TaxID=2794346 RepID=UPI0028A6255E|nr:recombinase family protein [Clostridium thailandense]